MALMALVVISALGQLGVNTTSFAAIIGAAALAIGFALQGSLANFAAGVMLILLVSTDERILKEPAPLIAVSELGDSSVNFVVRPWVKTPDYWAVVFDLTERVKLEFDRPGISIPFPQTDVHLHQTAT